MKRSHLFTAAAGAIAAMASPAYALDVGEARVLSFINQPLHVQIPIQASSSQWRDMQASAQTYQAGLGLTATLYKPTGERTEGMLEVYSKGPITEPVVDLQVTFDVARKITVHRASILIDVDQQGVLPVQAQQQPMSIAAAPIASPVTPVVSLSPAVRDTRGAGPFAAPQKGLFPEVKAPPARALDHVRASTYEAATAFVAASLRASDGNGTSARQRPAAGASTTTGQGSYTVKPGDALYTIANKHKPALWSTDETMAHIFKSNRHAFAGSAYKTLKAGAVLTFAWDAAMQSPNTLPSPETQALSVPSRAAQQDSAVFTENDAKEAVLRHRKSQLQQDLKTLQADRTR